MPIRKVTIPVAAGRNLAVLVEAAVRNYVLQLRGIDSTRNSSRARPADRRRRVDDGDREDADVTSTRHSSRRRHAAAMQLVLITGSPAPARASR